MAVIGGSLGDGCEESLRVAGCSRPLRHTDTHRIPTTAMSTGCLDAPDLEGGKK